LEVRFHLDRPSLEPDESMGCRAREHTPKLRRKDVRVANAMRQDRREAVTSHT
jgi:hypothetical protein